MSELPEGWAETTLNDLIGIDGVFADGDWIETKDQDPSGDVRLIQLADIGDGAYKNRSDRFLTTVTADRLDCTYLSPGDILVARMPEPIGRACIFPGDAKRAITAVDVCVVRPGSESVSAEWLMHAINSTRFRDQIEVYVRGTTRKRISRANLGSLTIAVPPLAEQHRIVAKIASLFKCISRAAERLDEAEHHLRVLRASILNAAYDGSLIGATVSEYERFDDVCSEIRGGNSATSGRVRTEWPVLRSSAVRPFEIDFDDLNYLSSSDLLTPNAEIREGDLLITRLSGSVEYVGNCALVANRPSGTFQIPDRIFRARVRPEFEPGYVEIMFNAPCARKPMEEAAKSSAGHQRISLSDLREVAIPRMPREQQIATVERFAVVMQSLRPIAMRTAAASRSSRDLRSTVLAKAVVGELVALEAELARRESRTYQPASVLLEQIRESHKDLEPTKSKRGGKNMAKRSSQSRNIRRPLEQMLRENGEMTPERLFDLARFDEDSVDRFFEELRSLVTDGKVRERRPNKTDVILEAAGK